MNLRVQDIEDILGPLSNEIKKEIIEADLHYENITQRERDNYILSVLEYLMYGKIVKAGPERLPDWENGWGQNFLNFINSGNPDDLMPLYHNKHTFIHWRQDIVRSLTPYYDYKIHKIIVNWIFDTYMKDMLFIYDFGCGPCDHLLRARNYNKKAYLVGLDWSETSQKIISAIKKSGIETSIEGINFNYYEPNYLVQVPEGTGVYTIASLEQVGTNFGPFLQFLLKKQPEIVVHLEPIAEVLDPGHLIDRLSIEYFMKRNYLCGYLTELRNLEREGRVEILDVKRTYTGSYYIEGHTLIAWKPRPK